MTLAFGRSVARMDGDAVVGLGIGGPEGPQYPLEALAETFRAGREDGFRSLPHAGEQDGAASIRAALDLVGAERIGHGIRCLEDPSLVSELIERGVPLEVCPTSNVALGICRSLAEHPLPRLIEAGVPLSLGSDDPPLFGTDLVDEYVRCAHMFGWGPSTIRALARASLEHAFMPEPMRARMAEAQDIIPDPPLAPLA
jgi:adenosine deaminase